MLPMIEWVCERAYLDCELVFQDTIPDMLQALVDGETDVCGATLSVDPEWTDRVEFIQPYFYSAGIALYMDQMAGQMLSEAGGWDAMSGQKVCAKPGLAQMTVRSCRRLLSCRLLLLLSTLAACTGWQHARAARAHESAPTAALSSSPNQPSCVPAVRCSRPCCRC
jgi:hypothetical protein